MLLLLLQPLLHATKNACERHYTRLSLMFSLILFGRVLFNGGYLAHTSYGTHTHRIHTRKESIYKQSIESERMGTRLTLMPHTESGREREKAYGRVCKARQRMNWSHSKLFSKINLMHLQRLNFNQMHKWLAKNYRLSNDIFKCTQ